MKQHNLKIKAEYARAKLDGAKPFEIRRNDRDFQVGDEVVYNVIDDNELAKKFANKVYEITYITNYEQKDGYVVFGDKPKRKSNSKRCSCYEEREVTIYRYNYYDGSPIPIKKTQGFCRGTREVEQCFCNGNKGDCTHYPKEK